MKKRKTQDPPSPSPSKEKHLKTSSSASNSTTSPKDLIIKKNFSQENEAYLLLGKIVSLGNNNDSTDASNRAVSLTPSLIQKFEKPLAMMNSTANECQTLESLGPPSKKLLNKSRKARTFLALSGKHENRKSPTKITAETVSAMNTLWLGYCKSYFGDTQKKITFDPNLFSKVTKMDFHGAIIKVVKSRNPSLVGINGTVILESCNTFSLACARDSKIKVLVVPKLGSLFRITLPVTENEGKELLLVGDQLAIRSHERSSRKWKPKPLSI